MNYEEARAIKGTLESDMSAASKALQEFPRRENGLTPDEVKFSPEFRAAKRTYDEAAARVRRFNQWFLKAFKKEERERRRAKRS